jgi:cell wall-associated NlpC family hydrolase
MSGAVVASALAPLYGSPDHRAEITSEAPLGHLLEVIEEHAPFLWVRCEDEHRAWVHRGHLLLGAEPVVAGWREEAHATSLGAMLAVGSRERLPVPLGARLVLENDGGVRLPDGRVARVVSGRVAQDETLREESRAMSAARWAEAFFGGAPYRWGGITTWGVDCSGLVQATYRVRGVRLPRDSAQQAEVGEPVQATAADGDFAAGDLLFFAVGAGRPRITHVAIADGAGYVVHASAAAGSVCRSPLTGGSAEAVALRETFAGARRVERPPAGGPAGRRG